VVNKLHYFAAVLACTVAADTTASLFVPADMVLIPDGNYRPLFRSITDLPVVPVKSFLIDRFPVSNREYLEFLQANPNWQRSKVKRIFADESYLKMWAGDLNPGTNAQWNVPVTYVSWFAAKAYAHWKAKRLPTVAEWEYAASASPNHKDGDNDPDFKKEVFNWYCTPTQAEPSPRGLHKPNYWGVYDLHGLVWEWAADFNTSMVTGDARSDTGLDRELFCGAGSVGAKDVSNFPAFMRYGFRSSLKADYCVHNLSFRCAKDL